MALSVPQFCQRDGRWAGQRLGTCDGVTIGSQGCLITSISMVDACFDPANVWTPDQDDNYFTDNGGYVQGCLVDWSQIQRLLPNTALMGFDPCPDSPAPIDKIKGHLDAGGLCILEARFGGDPNAMHFCVAVDYQGNDIIVNDPWVGDRMAISNGRFGSGDSSKDIWGVHYFGDTTPNNPPPAPIAPAAPAQVEPAVTPPVVPPVAPTPPQGEATPPPAPVDPSLKPPTPPASVVDKPSTTAPEQSVNEKLTVPPAPQSVPFLHKLLQAIADLIKRLLAFLTRKDNQK